MTRKVIGQRTDQIVTLGWIALMAWGTALIFTYRAVLRQDIDKGAVRRDAASFVQDVEGKLGEEAAALSGFLASAGRPKSKVLCFFLIYSEEEYDDRAEAMMKAWANRCTKTIFFGWKDDFDVPNIPHVKIVDFDEDGDSKSSVKAYHAWQYVYSHHLKDFDFFMRADFGSYVLMDNYYDYVRTLHPSVPHYFGKQLKLREKCNIPFVARTCVSLSRAALHQLGMVLGAPKTSKECRRDQWQEMGDTDDVALSDCLRTIGIFSVNTRDDEGRERFMVFDPEFMSAPRDMKGDWYEEYSYNVKTGPGCCSAKAISFQYAKDQKGNWGQPIVFRDGVWKHKK